MTRRIDMDVYTAQYNYDGPDRLDITVKGDHAIGKIFAPTWEMVNGIKSGEFSEKDYEWRFAALMNERYDAHGAFMVNFAQGKATKTLVCFCPPGAFCHRVIVAEGLERMGAVYKGERNIRFENENIYTDGDMLEIKDGILFHQVNCQGVMGAGIAKAIRDKWPVVFERYRQNCKHSGKANFGKCQFVNITDDLYVVNLFGQDRYGRDKRYTHYMRLRHALNEAKRGVDTLESLFKRKFPVYFPYRMSCSSAGGNWYLVQKMIKDIFPDAVIVRKG
jgi:hypothetical protein